MSDDVATRLATLDASIAAAARRHGRAPDSIALVAVSKRHPAAAIRAAYAAGQRRFGENYLQEALGKQEELADLDIEWHFIGAIQSNKTADIAAHFDWVHTVD
ncbi:MAG: alanine racemase, partial [Gammaproteobacteria bacterium]